MGEKRGKSKHFSRTQQKRLKWVGGGGRKPFMMDLNIFLSADNRSVQKSPGPENVDGKSIDGIEVSDLQTVYKVRTNTLGATGSLKALKFKETKEFYLLQKFTITSACFNLFVTIVH